MLYDFFCVIPRRLHFMYFYIICAFVGVNISVSVSVLLRVQNKEPKYTHFKLVFWPAFVRAAVILDANPTTWLQDIHPCRSRVVDWATSESAATSYFILFSLWFGIDSRQLNEQNEIKYKLGGFQHKWYTNRRTASEPTNICEHAYRIYQQRMQYWSSANFSVTNVARLLSSISWFRAFFCNT